VQTGLTPSHFAFFCLQLKQAALTGPSFCLPSCVDRVGPVRDVGRGEPCESPSGVRVGCLSGVMDCKFKCELCAEPGIEPFGDILDRSCVGR